MPIPRAHSIALLICTLLAFSCGPSRKSAEDRPFLIPDPVEKPGDIFSPAAKIPRWADSTLAAMTLEEKAAQLIMARAYVHFISTDSDEFQRLVRLVRDVKVGGLVTFQGDVYGHAVLMNKLQRFAPVPLLVAADYERGVAMRVRRATYFPDAMAIGATGNPDYAYRVARATAREARALGVHQNLAPVADINNNPNNPVINTRSFGEDPTLVGRMVQAYIRGLHDGGVISTAKHFPGHGDTGVDSHLDLPLLPFTRARLDSLELAAFRGAIAGGVMSVMMAHLEAPALDAGKRTPASLSHAMITGILKAEMGFDGLVITDALDMAGLAKNFSVGQAAVMAVKAGVDMILIPRDEQAALDALVAAVRRAEVTEQRLDESVRKILLLKEWLRLHQNRYVEIDSVAENVGTKEHWMLAREIARNAITVLRNENVLPLQQHGRKRVVTLMISDTEDNRTEVNRPGYQYPNEPFGSYFMAQLRRRYGNVESHRLTPATPAGALDSVLQRARRADIILLPLYVKVRSSTGKIGLPENMANLAGKLADLQKPAVVISFGNPYLAGAFPRAQAQICAYADAEVLVEAAVEALFGEIAGRGRLPVTIPGAFAYGTGLQFFQTELRVDDPAAAGFDARKLDTVDALLTAAIRDSAFPAAQVAIVKDGIVAYNKSFGTYTYDAPSREISDETMFDLASLTKVMATTAAVMKLFDQKKLSLDDRVGRYLPAFAEGRKSAVTIRHLLTHRSGMPAHRALWQIAATPREALDSLMTTPLVANPGDTTIYSDFGMMILGSVVEHVAGTPLADFVRREYYEPLQMNSTMFRPPRSVWSRCAPTEIDTLWRRTMIQGSVHDENAEFLGGVSGHAGLFSTATDLSIFMQMVMNGGTYAGVRYLGEGTVREFTRKKNGPEQRLLGWDLKSATGSSAGDLFSASSFGHTGFTGTSVWVDPDRNLFVILLTNRVHPSRAHQKIFKVRPALHDAVVRALLVQGKTGRK